jgi:hypothetical protein
MVMMTFSITISKARRIDWRLLLCLNIIEYELGILATTCTFYGLIEYLLSLQRIFKRRVSGLNAPTEYNKLPIYFLRYIALNLLRKHFLAPVLALGRNLTLIGLN